jgi:hypothetical protein
MGCTPLFLNAEPHRPGDLEAMVSLRMPALSSSIVSSSPSRYFSISSSSDSATVSTSFVAVLLGLVLQVGRDLLDRVVLARSGSRRAT